MEIKTDIQIAQEADLKPIREISDSIGIEEKYLELYGNYKAKIDYNMLSKVKDREDEKLILVTAISPQWAGRSRRL